MTPTDMPAGASPTTRTVYIMPRLQVSSMKYGQKEIRVGKAEFWPDEDATWASVVRKPRPAWLDIFRDFSAAEGERADVARGTLLVSDDDDWLRQNAQKVVPVLFVLGLDAGCWETPAEAFHYIQYDARDVPADLVSLMTKYGPLMEDANSLQLLPPLGLRGHRTVRVRLDDPFKTELIRRFDQNPDDRIVVACRHLFRTQFSDPFIAPFDQDEAAFCSCLEAVFDIQPSQKEIGKELGKRVAGVYPGLDGLSEWVEGLYVRRCDFDHGDSGADRTGMPPHKVRSYDSFEKRRGRWTVLRSLCLDLIRREVDRGVTPAPPLHLYNTESDLVRSYFRSTAVWAGLKKQFSVPNAGTAIHGLAGDALDKFREAAAAFLQEHHWECMSEPPEPSRVANVLKSAVVTLLNCPGAEQEEKDHALAVSRAAERKDAGAVRIWVARHEEWREYGRFRRPMIEHLKAVILQTARYYETVKQGRRV